MPIGVFSERSGLSAKRLRSYAAAGVLVPAAVDSSSGYRYYSPAQLREAKLIDALRTAGIPLADIATLLHHPSVGRHRAIWDRAGATADLEGMGTTICAAGLTGDGRLAIVNVGDSRAY